MAEHHAKARIKMARARRTTPFREGAALLNSGRTRSHHFNSQGPQRGGGRPCYFVPREALRPMEELRSIINESR